MEDTSVLSTRPQVGAASEMEKSDAQSVTPDDSQGNEKASESFARPGSTTVHKPIPEISAAEMQSPELPADPGAETRHEIMKGATVSLLIGAFFPCIPVAIVCSVLLTLIFSNEIKYPYQVVQQAAQSHTSSLVNETLTKLTDLSHGGSDVYWVWATTATTPGSLHTIASITGKVMPFITSTSMALVAFFSGRRILQASQHAKRDSMPTPHQMSILISLLNGSGVKPLWETIKYRLHNHERLVRPVHVAFWSLLWIVTITLAIQGVDSWFGVAVQPATVDILRASNTTSSFGRQLDSEICGSLTHSLPCIGNNASSCTYPCSITTWNTSSNSARFGLQHAQQAAEVLMNNSYTDFVVNVTNQNYAQYDAQHFFLGDIKSSSAHDFSATTLAVQTQCQMVTPNCTIGTGFTYGPFTAPSFSWSGAVGVDASLSTAPRNQSNVGIQFFNSNNHASPAGRNGSEAMFSLQNPVPFLVWSKGFPPIDTTADQFEYMRDNRYLATDSAGDPVFVLSCETSIFTGRYDWRDGSVSSDGLYDLTLAHPSYGGIYSAAFAMDTALGHLSLQDAAALAAYQNQPDLLAAVFANQFSRSAVALTAGITVPTANVFDQERYNDVLVTVVPKIPLWTLVALKAVYALFALGLAVLAVIYAEPLTTQDIKERLTIDGLAVGLFEAKSHLKSGVSEIEQLFDEHNRKSDIAELPKIGMVQNGRGGWTWATSLKVANSFGLSALTVDREDD